MPDPGQWLESLVARCLDAGAAGYRAQLDQICAEHPDAAPDLRERIAELEKMGFLGAPGSGSGSQWRPSRIGRYELTDLLGRGGMGVVFRGRAETGGEVAVKLVRPDLLADDRARERFRREALLVSRLAHPGICPLLEAGVDEGMPFLVMPLLDGQTFRDWGRQHRGERQPMLRHVESFARALHAAHEAGLVHRDVTPGNLFVTADGRAVVFDFGLARDTTGEMQTFTMSHEQLGTLPYMAPEQLGPPARIDRRADVYSLGIVLYEALAGRLPFESAHRSELSRLIASGEAPRLRRLVRDLPRALDCIVHKAMDVDPVHRYATAADLADDLQRFAQRQPVLARDVGALVRARRWTRQHPVAATTISLLGVLVLVGGVLMAGMNDALDRFRQMRDVPIVQDLIREADEELWPAHPDRLARMDRWLERARAIKARLPLHRAALAELRSRALPLSDELRLDEQNLIVLRRERDDKRARLDEAKASGRASAKRQLPELTQALTDLEVRLSPREQAFEAQRWQFTAFEERFLHQTLMELVRALERLVEPQRGALSSVEARRKAAETLAERSIGNASGSDAARRTAAAWHEAAARVATDPRFAGLELRPQLGLMPLGCDPESKLEEFAHLLSGEPPVRNEQGNLAIGDETGIVLVLIPGGTFWMGAQKDNPAGHNYDPQAEPHESPVHEVALDPYLLAKHEMTQGQWERIAGENPSVYAPWSQLEATVTLRHPVESVSQDDCVRMLRRLGLVLPTEAQWERAARAGTDTPWCMGKEKAMLQGAANIADAYCKANGGHPLWPYDEDLNDGHLVHAPVGSFRANPFALCDITGNVSEWCCDEYARYDERAPRAGDGRREASGAGFWMIRGGSWSSHAGDARSASRDWNRAWYRYGPLGCRPAGIVQP